MLTSSRHKGKSYYTKRRLSNTMKAARSLHFTVLIALVAIALVALAASAGTPEDPEISDNSGDAGGRDSHDIVKAWVDSETNTTVTFRMEMTALDAISPRDDWLSLPTTIYEYYFTIENADYCVRATVPVHGPFAAFTSFALYEVTYGASGNISYGDSSSVAGSYLVNDAAVSLQVSKADIGSPSQGDVVNHMWAASYFQPRSEDKELMDEAMSYDNPGKNYIIRGQFTQLYNVVLRADNSTMEGKPREVTAYEITIVSGSTTDVQVNVTNSSLPAGYYVNYSQLMPIDVAEESSVKFTLVITVPEEAKNGTDVSIILRGRFLTEEGEELETNELNLLLQVRFIPAKPPEEERTIFTILRDFIKDYYMYLVVIVVILIAALGIWFYLNHRTSKDDKALMEYQAYLEAQGQQRDMGGA
jgi:hypothetical protein